MVQISESTLSAIRQLLTSKGNVDITPLVEDLHVGNGNKDLIAINCSLVLSGIKPEINTETRYEANWRNIYNKWVYIKHSMILDAVTYRKFSITVDADGNETEKEYGIESVSYQAWQQAMTDPKTLREKCQARAQEK